MPFCNGNSTFSLMRPMLSRCAAFRGDCALARGVTIASVLLLFASQSLVAGKIAPARDSAALRAAMLAAHNDERLARGLPPLMWSEELAGEAAQSAARLAGEADPIAAHGKSIGGKPRGENLWLGTRGAFSFATMARGWLEERVFYVDGAVPNISRSGNWADVGHYSQMIWKTTSLVGCAMASNARNDLLVCRYDPPGNVMGRNALTGLKLP